MNIVRIEYDFRHGSMYGYDFSIDVSESGVARTSYFVRNTDQKTKENGKIKPKRWQKLLTAAAGILPKLEPVKPKPPRGEEFYALDEGSQSLYITFLEDGVETRVQYGCLGTQDFGEFVDVLREIAEKA